MTSNMAPRTCDWLSAGTFALSTLCACMNTDGRANEDCAAQLASALDTLSRTPTSNVASAANSTDSAAAVFEKLKLHGFAIDDAGRRSAVQLSLQRRADTWQGSVQQGDAPESTLLGIALQLLDKTSTLATYHLSYSFDTCEHVQPRPAARDIPWQVDLCRHSETEARPRVLRHAEARVSVQTQFVLSLTEGPSYAVSALGAADLASLDSAHLLRGVATVAQ